ncbi:hypothetical protein D8I35_10225 [Corticibacter populi]|uniref:Ig-like domain-containing protein n=1 Tax=Corticibacter populi TaxID=1550736 RepID=A0A3M6QV22_9BURK|nr:hypothetical protein D8I35_10225 [Corticibacter populi]
MNDLTITVSTSGTSHALIIDGSTVLLENTGIIPGTTADNGYTYTVRVSGSTTTIVIAVDSSNIEEARQSEGVARLIDSIAYQAQGLDVSTSDVSVSLQLDETRYDGAQGNATEGRITSTIHITRDSDLPVAPNVGTGLTVETAESFDSSNGVPGADRVIYSVDGNYAYAAGAGSFAIFSVDASGRLTLVDSVAVDGMSEVGGLIASSDGKSVYSLSSNGQLVEMAVGSDGSLSYVNSYSVGSGSSGSLAISADGSQVYADSADRQIRVFTRDVSSGRLVVSQQFPASTIATTVYDALNDGTGNYRGATITISRGTGANASDDYTLNTSYDGGTLRYSDGELLFTDYSNWPYVEKSVATFIITDGTLTITFTEDVSTELVNRVLSQISFQTSTPENVTLTLNVGQTTQNIALDGSYELQPLQALQDAIRASTVIQAGNYLYIVNNGGSLWGNRTLEVYQRNGDGTWSVLDNGLQLSADTDWDAATDPIAVSADGLYVYLSARDSGTLDVYLLDAESGFLNPVNSIALPGDADNASDLILDAEGKTLYVLTDDGSVSIYSVSGSRLTLQGSVSGVASSGDMALSDDGLSLVVANGDNITRYSLAQTLDLGTSLAFASDLSIADNNSDKLADGVGNYAGASITIRPSTTSGSFDFEESNGLRLADGKILSNGSPIADFSTNEDGALTIIFTSETSTAIANLVLQQITYTNSDTAAAGSLITLSITVSDGELISDEQSVTLRVNTTPALDASAADGYTLDNAVSETAYSFTLFEGLFGDIDGDALTWSVSGLPDGLAFDALTRTISGSTTQTGSFNIIVTVADASGGTSSLELALEVTQVANRAPQVNTDATTSVSGTLTEGVAGSVTLDSSLFSEPDAVYGDSLIWTVSGLPDGVTFDAATLTLSGTATTVGDYTLTVMVTDQSGQSAQTELTMRVITAVEAENQAPNIGADADSLYYVAGTISGFGSTGTYVNGLVLSSDETILVVASSTGNNGNGTHYLNIYSRDTTTGELTLIQVFTQGAQDDPDTAVIELDGLQNVTSVTYSADGSQLYLTGYDTTGSTSNHALVAFNVNNDGTLSYVGHSDNIGEKVLHVSVDESTGTLYALSATTLYAYGVDSAGTFTQLSSHTPANGFGTAVTMRVVNDTAYVLSGSRLTVYSVADSGELSYVGQMARSGDQLTYTNADGISGDSVTIPNNALSGSISMTVSEQGYVYVVTTNGYLTTLQYDQAAGTLVYLNATSVYSQLGYYPYAVQISADGSVLYVASAASTTMVVYSIGDDGVPATYSSVALGATGISRFAVSADGTSIYGGKHLFFGNVTLSSIQAAGASASYTEGGAAIQPAANVNLSDAEYDAQGSYKGSTLEIVRTEGANAADVFDFQNANGLTLNGNTILLDGTAIASFESTEGKVTITFTADVSKETVNAVLHQISYANTSNDPGSRISLTLSVADDYAASQFGLLLYVSEINDPPTLQAIGSETSYVPGGSPTALFDDVMVSATESSQSITSITLTVSGLSDGYNESLGMAGDNAVFLIDGASSWPYFSIQTVDADGNVQQDWYSASISVSVDSDGMATVTITSSNGLPVDAAKALVESLTYANSAGSEATSGDRVITLTSIQDNGGTDVSGIDTTELTGITTTVSVGLSNTAPTATATGLTSTYVEGSDGVALLSDVTINPGEAGQAIGHLTFTVSGVKDGPSEVLTIDGTAIALVEGSGTTSSGHAYTVTLNTETGVATVSLGGAKDGTSDYANFYFTSSISLTDAQAMLESMTYANTSDDPTEGERNITLASLTDTGGTANGGVDTSALSIAATVTVSAINDAPTIDAQAAVVSYSVASTTVNLFGDVTLSTIEAGQNIHTITFTVSGASDGGSEILTVDNTAIALTAGSGTTVNGHIYSVIVDNDVVTVTINANGVLSTAAATSLIESTSYANNSNTQTAGARSIGLSIQDDGGTANGGSDSAVLTATAIVTVVENAAPSLDSSLGNHAFSIADSLTSITGLSNIAASAMNSAGSALYVASSDGSIAILAIDTQSGGLTLQQTLSTGLSSINTINISADGGTVFVLGNDGDALAIYTAADMQLQQTLVTENLVDFSIAEDGAIYAVDGNYSGLRVYTLDNGSYTLTQSIAASTSTEPYLFSGVRITVLGNYVYVATDPIADSLPNTLIVYQRASDSTLTALAHIRDGSDASLGSPLAIVASDDGGTVYVANDDRVSIFAFDSISNTLTQIGTIDSQSTIGAIALSADGRTLYVVHADSSIGRYQVSDDGQPILLETLQGETLTGATNIWAGSEGTLVVSGAGGVTSLSDRLADEIELTYGENTTIPLTDMLMLSDADYDILGDGSGNYNGAAIGIARSGGADASDSYGFADSNGLTYADGVISLAGTAIATLTVDGGALTVTFTADVSTATANLVLQQITYTNTSDDPGSSIALELTVTDQYDASTSVTLALAVTQVNDAPTLTSTGATTSHTEGGNATALFSGTAVATVESGQSITSLTLAASGISDGTAETLTIDGTAIALVAGSGTTGSGLAYTVTVADGSATITLASSTGITANAAAALVDAIAYANASDDPTAGARTITLTSISDDGGTDSGGSDTTALAISATVTVIAVNDAPTLTSTGATTSHTEGGSATALFSGTSIATVESGQSITSLTLTASGISDGTAETLTIDGTAIALVAGSGTTGSGLAYTVTVADGSATITLASSTGITANAAAALVDAIAYANASDDPTAGARTITLTSISDDGGTDSGGSNTTGLAISATVTVIAVNDAPTLISTGASTDYAASGNVVLLFSDTVVDTVEASQTVAALTFTAEGIADATEQLVIDDTAITLTDGNTGSTASGYTYSVSLASDGTATLTLTLGDAGLSTDAAAALIDAIAYQNASSSVSTGTRTVTLTSVQDNGGTSAAGNDTTALAISASITVINSAPQADATDYALSPLTQGDTYSATLPDSLFSDADGDTLNWSIDGLPEGLGFDANTLTISGSTTADAGSYTITITATDASGSTATQTLVLTVAAATPDALRTDIGHGWPASAGTSALATLADPFAAPDWSAQVARGAPLTSAALNATAWTRANSFSTADGLLDALRQPLWEDTPNVSAEVLFADGSTATPLVLLAAADAPALEAREARVVGQWVYDPSGNRMVAQLPEGLIASRQTIAALELRSADGRALPAGIRLDLTSGSIIAPGVRAAALDLLLVLRTTDGQSLSLPVHIAPAGARLAVASTQDDAIAIAAKPALSDQLRQGPASDLLHQAQTLLRQLAEAPPVHAEATDTTTNS